MALGVRLLRCTSIRSVHLLILRENTYFLPLTEEIWPSLVRVNRVVTVDVPFAARGCSIEDGADSILLVKVREAEPDISTSPRRPRSLNL